MSWARTFSAAMMRSPSFSRFSSSTMMTILPARMSSMMSSMLLKVAADGCKEVLLCITMCPEKIPCDPFFRGDRRVGAAAQQALEVTRDQVHLDVDLTACLVASRDRHRPGVRDDRHLEPPGVSGYRVDGEADAVDADRSLVDHVTEILVRYTNAQAYRPCI